MKLWEKGYSVNRLIENFTVGKDKELDVWLAKYDVLGTMAHIKMLESINLLTKDELQILLAELRNILNIIADDEFIIEDGIEDVHSQVELMLTRKLGDTGKKVHSGRSRNDQVLLDLKLYTRAQLKDTVEQIDSIFKILINHSEKYKHIILPGYTHLQIAMPSSFGLWFGAYAESLSDDMNLMLAAYQIVNQNPLGSAAGYGSSFPLNRQMTTELLGFDKLNYNVVYAQMGRGKVEKITAFAIANLASTLSKMAMDVSIYMTPNFGFISFPDEFTTGSSIMPHKKNPDVFELIRAKCNKLQSLPNEIALITSNLPSGYHRDMQLIKEIFMPAFSEIISCLQILELMLNNAIVNENILVDDKYKYLFSVEEVNKLVLDGVPFRDAYKKVAKDIAEGNFEPEKLVHHTHEGSIGNLCNNHITEKMEKLILAFDFPKVEKALKELISK